MTGTLSQLITLVAYGNQYIANPGTSINFPANHSAFQYCKNVFFSVEDQNHPSSENHPIIVAESPVEWFGYLAKTGCKTLKLYYESSDGSTGIKDHKLAGMIGGGGAWLIEAIYPENSDFWYGAWEVTRDDATNSNVWTVNYKRIQHHIPSRNLQLDIETQKNILSDVLAKIEAFADEVNAENFAGIFQQANAWLTENYPERDYYHTDLLPDDTYSIPERQLFFAASGAWVFGGMGSWNDMGFVVEQQQVYENLSSALYTAINNAIIAAINS
ncbi:hypothetical protein [Pedobacter sp. UBA5917]|jgi:hypothetical protein|uniref:hypothetical protein n=1 Tax=Pedobacter sp. UBA5917 TaxID=1947061 RepID=UPI0025EC7985|nr:hypothetical protein [Pedobacter sp. UBA5917]